MRVHATWDSVAATIPSFASQYRIEIGPELQQAICTEFVNMATLFAGSPSKVGERYDRISYLDRRPYELDITRGWRGIVQIRDGRLALYRVGDHNMIERSRFSRSDMAKADQEPLLPFTRMVCDSVINAAGSNLGKSLVAALDSRWFYQLDSEQSAVVDRLAAKLEDPKGEPSRALITGGPGTGKTTILVQLANLLDWDPKRVALVVSDPVAEYLTTGLGERVIACRTPLKKVTHQVALLVDDPPSWAAIQSAVAAAGYRGTRLIVVATDLAQVENVVSDTDLEVFLGGLGIEHVRLRDCYRQTANVGAKSVTFLRHISRRFTKHISAENVNKFARQHRLSVESADDMRFVSAGGFSRIYENASLDDVRGELENAAVRPQWQQWHPACLVVERGVKDIKSLQPEITRLRAHVVDFADTDSVRGVEFQYVFMLISRQTLHQIMVTGRSGLSTQDYIAARNMRVPFSRATDGLVVFGMDTHLS